ncbi:hypothetical protein, partial [Escherichia coli]
MEIKVQRLSLWMIN